MSERLQEPGERLMELYQVDKYPNLPCHACIIYDVTRQCYQGCRVPMTLLNQDGTPTVSREA